MAQVHMDRNRHILSRHMVQVHMDQNHHILSRHMDHMDLDMDLAGVEHQEIN